MRRTTTWWRGLSEPDRFRHYTRLTYQVVIVVLAVSTWIQLDSQWPLVGILLAGAAGAAALESRPELSDWPSERLRRWATPVLGLVLAALTGASALAARLSTGAIADGHRAVAVYCLLVAALAIIPFLAGRWWVLTAAAVALTAVLAEGPDDIARLLLVTVGTGILVCGTTLLGLWSVRVVTDLERARSAEAELKVAEERLRFSRDLHDVVGRGFSTIAVKSELAATLARSGHAGAAAAEMEEVKSFAVDSMDQMRALVRGYREISLGAEVDGAVGLLSAAGCRLEVQGGADQVPRRFHEAAAWVVREGTTNIVKHSTAENATLALGADGMMLRNDTTTPVTEPRSGQRGLAERLAAVGATITTSVQNDQYILEVRWEAA